MFNFIVILIIVTCVLLTLIVLVQNSKGGGLAADFSSSNQTLGVRKTSDFLEKGTWALAIILLVLSLSSNMFVNKGTDPGEPQESEIKENYENAPTPTQSQPNGFGQPQPPAQQPAN